MTHAGRAMWPSTLIYMTGVPAVWAMSGFHYIQAIPVRVSTGLIISRVYRSPPALTSRRRAEMPDMGSSLPAAIPKVMCRPHDTYCKALSLLSVSELVNEDDVHGSLDDSVSESSSCDMSDEEEDLPPSYYESARSIDLDRDLVFAEPLRDLPSCVICGRMGR